MEKVTKKSGDKLKLHVTRTILAMAKSCELKVGALSCLFLYRYVWKTINTMPMELIADKKAMLEQVGLRLAHVWPQLGPWLAHGWPMAGPSLADGWPKVGVVVWLLCPGMVPEHNQAVRRSNGQSAWELFKPLKNISTTRAPEKC